MFKFKVNHYNCSCGGTTTTIDLHEGVTPFMITCPVCNKEMATSAFYKYLQSVDADFYWYRPSEGEFSPEVQEYLANGGLLKSPTRRPLRPIKLQRQPNRATCLVTAFAMVLDVPVAELIEQIGHDGMEVIFPDAPEPTRFRGHHIQELIYAGLVRGYAVTPIEPIPTAIYGERAIALSPLPWFERCLSMRHGVLTGQSKGKEHAIAWDGEEKFDPSNTMIGPIGDFRIRTFYAVTPQSNPIYES